MKDYKWINTRKYFFAIKDLIATYLYINGQKYVIKSFVVDEDKKYVALDIIQRFNPYSHFYTASYKEEIDGILRSVTYLHDNRPDPGD